MRLGINIDHIATLRQARGGSRPDPVEAARVALQAGCDGITLHLREDRRHVQEKDLRILREDVTTHLNLEMALTDDIIRIALDVKPDQVTFVPEKREEITTEGGLDVMRQGVKLKETIQKFQNLNILVSLFIDPDSDQIRAAQESGALAIELHTGSFADAFHQGDYQDTLAHIERAAALAKKLGLKVFAGHGLDYDNIGPMASNPDIEEVNIGHAIVAKSVFVGFHVAVAEMKQLIQEARQSEMASKCI